jgi:acyl-CoA dehydrogenase
VLASLGIRRAQEILGGNGAIEDFSIIPRLYRDAVVYESWEGSHNVLCVQALRDMQRYRFHEPLATMLRADLDRVTTAELRPYVDETLGALDALWPRLEGVLAAPPAEGQAHIRRVLDRLYVISQASHLLTETEWALADGEQRALDLLAFFYNRHLRAGYDPLGDAEYGARLGRLAGV